MAALGLHTGPAYVLDDFGAQRTLATGWTTGLSALVSLSSLPLDVEFGAGFTENDYDDAGPSGTVQTWVAGASGLWRPVAVTARLQPYLLGGLGVYYVEEPDRNKITPALVGGAGVRVLVKSFQVYAEARYQHVFYTGEDLRLLPVVLGLRYAVTP